MIKLTRVEPNLVGLKPVEIYINPAHIVTLEPTPGLTSVAKSRVRLIGPSYVEIYFTETVEEVTRRIAEFVALTAQVLRG